MKGVRPAAGLGALGGGSPEGGGLLRAGAVCRDNLGPSAGSGGPAGRGCPGEPPVTRVGPALCWRCSFLQPRGRGRAGARRYGRGGAGALEICPGVGVDAPVRCCSGGIGVLKTSQKCLKMSVDERQS